MGSSRSEFAEFFRDLRMPESLVDVMREAPGPVVSGDDILAAVKDAKMLVTVGDYCTKDMIDRGRPPDIALVDFKTRREDELDYHEKLGGFGEVVKTVNNPPGMITKEAWLAVSEAFKSKKRVRLDILGEEDLLALVCVALAPLGAAVMFGLPGKGAAVVHVDRNEKRKMRGIFERMVE